MTDFGVLVEDHDDDDVDFDFVLDGMLDAVNLPDQFDLYFLDGNNNSSSLPHAIPSAVDSSFSTIGQIQEFLLNDDDVIYYLDEPNHHLLTTESFLSDVLLDSQLPPPDSSSPSSDNLSPEIDLHDADANAKDSGEQQPNLTHQLLPPDAIPQRQQGEMEEEEEKDKGDQLHNNNIDDVDADPIAKKRKRQLRNRDAAVRSRERRKMYVKDLEMKSRYYEAECRRLGMLLQCYLAENHALRLSLHNNTTQAFDASTTKQESAVLLLESLLLGSLLWFLGVMSLLILPRQLLSILEAAGAENVRCKNLGSLAPRGAGSNVFGSQEFQSFMMSKRCRGSRRKMR